MGRNLKKPFLLILLLLYAAPSVFTAKKVCGAVLKSNSLLEIAFDDRTTRTLRISPALAPGEKRRIPFSIGTFDRVNYAVEVMGETEGLAELLISEFVCKGRNGNDMVELYVAKGGRTDGIALFSDEGEAALPSSEVSQGQYLSCGLDMKNSKGFIEIRTSANRTTSRILDKVRYSTGRNGESEASDAWQGEGVDVTKSTATRSVNRRILPNGGYADTNTANDFYITVTRGATIGGENNPKIFE
ncbi:MAG TPA: hypothetical protein DCO86_00275 [Spirochaetaceae bacterium]|nr:hypothetical protein [Spirochaetaceae bacterium]